MVLSAARAGRAKALLFLGQVEQARAEVRELAAAAPSAQRLELAGDIGEAEALVGEAAKAWPLIESVSEEIVEMGDLGEEARLARALIHLQTGPLMEAREDIATFKHGRPAAAPAFEAKRYLTEGYLDALEGRGWSDAGATGLAIARAQKATFWESFGEVASSLAINSSDPSLRIIETAATQPRVISAVAELILARFEDLGEDAIAVVAHEAEGLPWRWRPSTRRAVAEANGERLLALARLLERIGETQDVNLLRDASRRLRGKDSARLGHGLARRIAERVFVEDLGRVSISVGSRLIYGHEVRRKVLALLCLLLSRPRFASTRDDVLDSLWPEHDPASALNSLNQTVYFLRRVFEPNFEDDTSPGYVGQDGETIWLDPELVDSRSRRCQQLIRSMPAAPTPDGSVTLATEYRGRFALDFAYEEWSAPYRDTLHASYLRIVEHAVRLDMDSGHIGRGTYIAERAAEVDPDAEEIQVALVRLYRHSGAHAAAGEQYANYARVMEELGAEPAALDDL
jgi:DNA-binding SARP family transcriptional activator